MTKVVFPRTDPNWLTPALSALKGDGYAVLDGLFDDAFLEETRSALYRAEERVRAAIGAEKLERAGEMGVVRLPMLYDAHFYRLLETAEFLSIIDATVGETAIMHLQNGFVLPSHPPGATPQVFQNSFHRDFPRILNGYLCSVNCLVALSDFTEESGATLVIPGSHQKDEAPAPEILEKGGVPAVCPAGSVILFDSTLFHAAGPNVSGKDRLAINHQFTRPYFKQQMDYPRAIGWDRMGDFSPRQQQLLGYWTRPPTSLAEYYVAPEERLYRGGQG